MKIRQPPVLFEVIEALDKKYDGFASIRDSEYGVARKLVVPIKKQM
jgi:hypothetical protein